MDVQMRHSLPSGRSLIDSDVVAIRVMSFVENRPRSAQSLEQGELLGVSCLEQRGDVPLRNDERMSKRKREAVFVDDGKIILGHYPGRVTMAKRARFLMHH
jgi:hypothetical protein